MTNSILDTRLYDQSDFYPAFSKDLKRAKVLVIIESPFITHSRAASFTGVLSKLVRKGVIVIVNTKPLDELSASLRMQSLEIIAALQDIGVTVLFTAGHHRKLALIDDEILWEGSLNILSQFDSCEIMRRMVSTELVEQMITHLGLRRWIS